MLALAPASDHRRDVAVLLEQQAWGRGPVVRPVDRRRVRARLLEGDDRPVVLGRVARPQAVVVGLHVGQQLLAPGVVEQRGDRGHGARRILHPDHRTVVPAVDLDRGVGARRRRTADEKGDLEALSLHLAGHRHHLVERGGDQARQADHVGLVLARRVQDLLRRHHDSEVDDLVVVALQHHADDVLADVVDVALHGRHHDGAVGVLLPGERGVVGLLLLDEGDQVGDGLLHDPGALHDLGQEHLPGAEEVADDVHAVHQRALDDLDRPAAPVGDLRAKLLGVGLDMGVDALHQGVGDALGDRQLPPLLRGRALVIGGPVELLGDLEQPLPRVGASVEHHVLDPLAKLGVDLVVDHQRPGVDDAHVETGLDRVEEEDGVDGLAHRVVPAE